MRILETNPPKQSQNVQKEPAKMDEDLYDEFGNLIGDSLDSDAESSSDEEEVQFQHEESDKEMDDSDNEEENRIILQEDKRLYSTMSETYGPGVEIIVQTHDNQSINEPLVKPTTVKTTKIEEKKLPKTTYSKEYLAQTLAIPSRVRNVSIVGSLNSGKTSILDSLIIQTHQLKTSATRSKKGFKRLRYTDNTNLEIERGLTLKSSAISLLLPNLRGSSIVLSVIDTPGHINFVDEVSIAQRLTDISLVVIDVVEGLTVSSKKAIDNALLNNLSLAFVLNKIDRLILELRLTPQDSYHKLRYAIDEINTYVQESEYYSNYKHKTLYSPDLNNIVFSSSDFNFQFNLRSFAKLYSERYGLEFNYNAFAKRLWGDISYDPSKNEFSKTGTKRSFIHFILEPLYKTVTHVLTKDPSELQQFIFDNFGISISKDIVKSDPQVLLKEVFRNLFGDSRGLVDVLENLPSPEDHEKTALFTGKSEHIISSISKTSSEGPLIAHISKMVENNLGLVRIFSGILKKGDKVKILGENFNDDDEDFQILKLEELFIPGGRYNIPVEEAHAGAIILVGGIEVISKSGSIFSTDIEDDALAIFKTIDYLNKPVFKIIIEPQVPSELPKLLDGLRKINKTYCGVEIKVEESGEHVIFGSGELYLDSLLYDLRNLSDINIKVSDPITKFSETIADKSFTKISIKSQNDANEITIIAEPLEEKLSKGIEDGKIQASSKRLNRILRDDYGWDSLEARSFWSFGPDSTNGPNVIIDDTLPDEVDKELLTAIKESIIQGFQWATKEGPLTDEPVRDIKFRIIDAKISSNPLKRGNGQIIPMVRNACYSAILTSTPRLMEPVYFVEIVSTSSTIKIIEKLLDKRRGAVFKDEPIPATQLYKIHGFVPVIDSIGLETDIRVATQGQALVSLSFEKWDTVPGDPLDKDVFIPKLRPADINSLARDFVMKTRKRKGLSGEPSLVKYIDKELVDSLKQLGLLE